MFHIVGKISIILSRIRIFYVLEDLFAVARSSGESIQPSTSASG